MPTATRRAAAAFLILLLTSTAADARRRVVRHPRAVNGFAQGAYASSTSVIQGQEITFHVATTAPDFTLEIVNLADPERVLRSFPHLDSMSQDCTGLYREGCGWQPTLTMRVPGTWPSGYYAARFPTADGIRYVPFVVRAAAPGATSPILVVSSTHTYQAHNRFGGASLQPSLTSIRADVVSFDRPYHAANGLGRFPAWEEKFIMWMRDNELGFEVATDHDLEDPTLLSRYNVVVLVGHSSYWTSAARRNLEAFSAAGGHIAILGGNTMWWQARLENNGRSIVVYKNAARDPQMGHNNDLVTVNWFDFPLFNPENEITGTSFRNGGFSNRAGDPSTWSNDPETFRFKPLEERTGFTIRDPHSWVFEGLNLRAGHTFAPEAAGLEVDGVVFNCDAAGLPSTPDGSDGTPLNYHILAYTPASGGYGTVGIYVNPNGGAVFNAATQEWVGALFTDPIVSRVTKNVLTRFATGARLPHDAVPTPLRLDDRFNCPQPHSTVIPWWDGVVGTSALTSACAYEGPTGLQVKGPAELSIVRNFAPTGQPLPHVEARFLLNADEFVLPNEWPVPLVTLRKRLGGDIQRLVQVELFIINGQKVVRLAHLRPDGTIETATPWAPLPSGWQPVEFAWESPGAVTLRVGTGEQHALTNPRSGEGANEIVIYHPAATGEAGSLCVDSLVAGVDKLPPPSRF